MAMKLIEFNNVSFGYDREPILTNVRLSINRGDFVAITGPNGGGKSTLLKLLLHLLKPQKGSVQYFNEVGSPTNRLAIGYLPQKSQIDTRFPITVKEVVRQGQLAGFFMRKKTEKLERYNDVVSICGLEHFENQTIGTLSGGQLQRTLLARAIVSKPELLVLDEPLSYVDKQFEHRIYNIIEELAKTTTIILVSHEMTVISKMANRYIEVDRGITENKE